MQGTREHLFQPFDLAVDPVSRVLFWTCAETNSINITRMDIDDDYDDEGDGRDLDADVFDDDIDAEDGDPASVTHNSILGGDLSGLDVRPRSLAVHSRKGIVFFVNMASPIRYCPAMSSTIGLFD